MDDRGRPHLPRAAFAQPDHPGTAQVSRLVFSTPRVSELLGLKNRELSDLNKSSLDTVSLGRPHLLYLPHGIVQIQSLYNGASGPGVSRLIGVTAFLNGRAGVGSTSRTRCGGAARAAGRRRPETARTRRGRNAGRAVLPVQHARREAITITSPAGRQEVSRSFEEGVGSVTWVRPLPARFACASRSTAWTGPKAGSTAFRVLSPAPAVQVAGAPARARVGRPVRFSFKVADAVTEVAEVSTPDGTLTRRYRIRKGTGFVEWTPTTAGPAELLVRARGREGRRRATR